MIKRILVPVDFSPVTDAVTKVAMEIAAKCDATVVLLHVAPAFVADVKTVEVPQHERDFLAGKLREEHRDLQALAEELASGGTDVEPLMVECHGTVEKIVEEADRLDADLIVAGSHGHGRIYDLLVGSICEGILRTAKVPVLIVPAVMTEAAK
ncbi:MAG: universal stress protein [Planctomycetota bacterium]|jgi:nucleotide-binding universal stress UspA family protein